MAPDSPATVVEEPLDAPSTNYKRGFAWTFLFTLVTKVATAVIGILVARWLSEAVFGLYTLLLAIMGLVEVIRHGGIAQVYLNDSEMTPEKERTYAGMSLALGVAMGTSLLLAASPLAAFYRQPDLRWGLYWTSAAVFINGASMIPHFKLFRQGRFRDAGLAEASSSVLSSLYALVLVHLGYGFFALVSQLVVRSVLFLGLTYALAPCGYLGGDRSAYRGIVKLASSVTGTNILWVLFSMADRLIIARVLGVVATAHFGMAKFIGEATDVVSRPVTDTAKVAIAHRAGERSAVGEAMYKSLIGFLIIVAPIYVGLAVLAEPIILALLGPKYAPAAALMPAIGVYSALRHTGDIVGSTLLAIKRPHVNLVAWLIAYPAMAAALVALWDRMTLVGFAWLFTLGLLLANGISFASAVRSFAPSANTLAKAGQALVGLTLMALASWLLLRLELAPILVLAAAAIALPMVYLAAIGILFARNPLAMFRPSGMKLLWARL